MSNWLLLDAKAKQEKETEKERNGVKQKPESFPKANPLLIFVLTNQVSLFEAKIMDHSVSYLIPHIENFLCCPPAISVPFLRKIFVLVFILPPLCFSIKSGQVSQDTAAHRKVLVHPG